MQQQQQQQNADEPASAGPSAPLGAVEEDRALANNNAEDEDDVEDDVEEEEGGAAAVAGGGAAGASGKGKKKKKPKKKKKAGEGGAAAVEAAVVREDGSVALDLSGRTTKPLLRGLGDIKTFGESTAACNSFVGKFAGKVQQTWPPTIPMDVLFPEGVEPPTGEIREHPGDQNRHRITSEELRAEERFQSDLLRKVRMASECHREVRKFAQSFIKPGINIAEMCEALEDRNRLLIRENGPERGIGFPTGVSLNHVAAHWTPNPGDKTVLQYDDVMKVDFGTQVEGRIIDCAFTVAFNPMYDDLLRTVREATNAGLAIAGIDVRLCDVGAAVQEVMEAGEVEIRGKVHEIKCCRNLQGHSIAPYQIHGGKSVPIVRGGEQTTRMEENEFYAIETFGSTGRGFVVEDLECSHYAKTVDAPRVQIRLPAAAKLFAHIGRTFRTLAFCRRWLERPDGGSFVVNKTDGQQTRYMGALKNLVDLNLVTAYPPLCDVPGSYVAQYEHTFFLRPTCKEILSRGDDF